MEHDLSKSQRLLKIHGIAMIILLTVQYMFGMITNLFITFPEEKREGQLWEFAWRQFPLSTHIIIGFLLLIGSLLLLIRSIKYKNRNWIIASVIGMLSISTAIVGGSIFIPSQAGIFSFIMATAFIFAFLSYTFGIYTTKK